MFYPAGAEGAERAAARRRAEAGGVRPAWHTGDIAPRTPPLDSMVEEDLRDALRARADLLEEELDCLRRQNLVLRRVVNIYECLVNIYEAGTGT